MIFLYLSPFFIAVNVLFIYEAFKWIDTLGLHGKLISLFKIFSAIFWGGASIAIYVAFLMPSSINADTQPFLYTLRRLLKLIGNYHMAVFIYMGMLFVCIFIGRLIEFVILEKKGTDKTEACRIVLRNRRRAILGIINIVFIVCITVYGVFHADNIKVNDYEIVINKDAGDISELKLVMVADLHLGYSVGCRQMQKMVGLINAEEPDLVVIAGDIFDNEYEALDDPEELIEILSSIKSKYGVYAVYGNHDVDEKILSGFTFNHSIEGKGSSGEMDDFIERCGIRLLMDEGVLIEDSFYLYGRPDYLKPGKTINSRKAAAEITSDMDLSKPVIVIDHEPRELEELAEAGIDLDLCGHTHDGQFFPMNLTSRYLTWENSAGMITKNNMYNIVTSGVGLFGPNIRIGTDSEICPILIRFEK